MSNPVGAQAAPAPLQAALLAQPRRAVVVGAGLAGSAAAYSLAQRGWQVQVLDAAVAPAAGASALPAGLVAPHVSPDDAPLSRISRAGVSATLARLAALLPDGTDWAATGVLERRVEHARALPPCAPGRPNGMEGWSVEASPERLALAQLDQLQPATSALWHPCGAWMRPARLVQAQLAQPGIEWRGGCSVARLQPTPEGWALFDAQGQTLAQAPWVVLAAGFAVRGLLASTDWAGSPLPLHALRGQVSWGLLDDLPAAARAALPPWPVNGYGSFLHGMNGPSGAPMWIVGSTFERGNTSAAVTEADHAANQARLQRLLPRLGTLMQPAFHAAQGWAAVRCTLPDRLPAVGVLDAVRWPGLHVLTGLGARGLTLSVLAGEVLAAQLHGEPWPLEPRLAQMLLAQRFSRRSKP
ncbi:FAD-dependent 5-carboxymethylaminomethyl-2-thiouridine(34) oxidoreductase MnmC [Serpentinimonas raichei]|uniref:FAD-dependent 5-carboxymethylaminomethyl-2-thiouridine(34) oxidoreductase MnmC n=1 Tax=Serpentinimonas raichei TaxID=1458425 RepID=UPI000AFA8A87|nr:FAD-dependent 5-carboxymethylaminomethyl-2-thiouridine(34) oxidoreductase MnmC [Serpentinimonas raichei]